MILAYFFAGDNTMYTWTQLLPPCGGPWRTPLATTDLHTTCACPPDMCYVNGGKVLSSGVAPSSYQGRWDGGDVRQRLAQVKHTCVPSMASPPQYGQRLVSGVRGVADALGLWRAAGSHGTSPSMCRRRSPRAGRPAPERCGVSGVSCVLRGRHHPLLGMCSRFAARVVAHGAGILTSFLA